MFITVLSRLYYGSPSWTVRPSPGSHNSQLQHFFYTLTTKENTRTNNLWFCVLGLMTSGKMDVLGVWICSKWSTGKVRQATSRKRQSLNVTLVVVTFSCSIRFQVTAMIMVKVILTDLDTCQSYDGSPLYSRATPLQSNRHRLGFSVVAREGGRSWT
jgi:hypothetical protein